MWKATQATWRERSPWRGRTRDVDLDKLEMIEEVLEGEVGGSRISSGSQRVAASSACLWRGGRLATKSRVGCLEGED